MGKQKLNTRKRLRHHRMVVGEKMPSKPRKRVKKIAQAQWEQKRTGL